MDNVDLLQQLMDNIEDNIFFKDRDSKFLMISKANARWFGLKNPDEVVGKDDFDFFTKAHALKQIEEEQWIMRTGKAVLCEEQATSREGYTGWGSVTKLPLRDKDGNIIGTMGIGRDISELKNKELQLKHANDQIAEDLKMAAKVQKAFLPQDYPVVTDTEGRPLIQFFHLYQADTELGGDFCSIYPLSETETGLLICDVMGHGVRAALITAIIHATAEELVRKSITPADFLTALNQRLYPVLHTEDEFLFATAAYFTIDAASGLLTGAIAGHPMPFLIHSAGGPASKLQGAEDVRGPALAVTAEHAYESIRAQLQPGDKLLLYTDGILEAVNAGGEEFGDQHLRDILQENGRLPLDQLLHRIVDAVRQHAESSHLGDDVCLLGFSLSEAATAASG